MADQKTGHCPLCGHWTRLTLHHTIWPRKKYHNHPKRQELTVMICRECHDMVHEYYDHTRFRSYGQEQATNELWQL